MHSKSNGTTMMFISGLFIGGILTALFTPNTGEEARTMIKDKIDKAKDHAKDTAQKATDIAEENVDKAKRTIEKGKDKLNKQDNDSDNGITRPRVAL